MSVTNSTLPISLVNIYAGSPNTERGRQVHLGVDSKGETMVYACNTQVIMRDLKDQLKVRIYPGHSQQVTVAKYSPSGYYVASGDIAGNLRIWATDNEDMTSKLEIRPISGPIRDIAFTSDSQRICAVGEGKDSFSYVCLVDTGSTVGEVSGHSKPILTCDFRQSRPFKLVTGGEDFLVNFYAGPPFKFTLSIKKHTRFVNCVRFSPDGSVFVTASSDGNAYFFDGKTAQEVGQLDKTGGHKGTIYSVSWSPDGSQLITSSADKTCKLWDFKSKKCITTFTFENSIDFMQVGTLFTKDSMISLSLNGNISFLNPNDPKKPLKVFYGHNQQINNVIHDSNILYSAGSEGMIISWEYGVGSKALVTGKGSKAAVTGIGIVGKKELVACYQDNTVAFISLDTFSFTGKVLKVEGTPRDLVVGGDLILIATYKGIIVIKDQQVQKIHTFNYEPVSVGISPDGKECAVGGGDKKVHIYSIQNGSDLSELTQLSHLGIVNKVRYSPDGTMIAAGDSNKEIIVWDVASRKPKYDELCFHSAGVKDLDWSKDSKYLVSGSTDKTIIVWDLENKQRAIALAHQSGVSAVCFVKPGIVVSAGMDYCLKSWQFSTDPIKK